MNEKEIRNFDRHVEQMMNENAVTPPFGMWNRIAAELDAVPVAEVAPAPRNMLPKGLWVGFVSGALVIGTLISGWLAYNGRSLTNNASPSTVTNELEKPVIQSSATLPQHVQEANEIVIPPATIEPVRISARTVAVNKIKKVEIGTTKRNMLTTEVAVPTQKQPVDKQSKAEEPYYFPPVDIDVPENASASADDNNQEVADGSDAKNNDSKKAITSSSEQRVKFRKKRKSSWSYPRIIRTRKPKGHY